MAEADIFEVHSKPWLIVRHEIFDVHQHLEVLPPLVDAEEFTSFKTKKRKGEHIAGRTVLADILFERGFEPTQLEVVRNEFRAPSLAWLQGSFQSRPLPGISIGHSMGHVVVALIEPGWWVGIDAEPLTRSISEKAFDQFCKGEELVMLKKRPELARLLWTAKEAVQKAMHMGMALNPRGIIFENDIPIADFINNISIENIIIQLKIMVRNDLQYGVAWRPADSSFGMAEDELLDVSREEMRGEEGDVSSDIGCVAGRD